MFLSCDTIDDGCVGGLMDDAFTWAIESNGGRIVTSASYPFMSAYGSVPSCSLSAEMPVGAVITGFQDIQSSEQAMAAFTGTGGPLSIGVDATSWQTYTGGILTNCVSNAIDHGVLIVGFDLTYSTPYWIIKNSWGASWGESGYIRVAYGSNQCLLTTIPSTAVVAKSTPAPPTGAATPAPAPSNIGGTFTQYFCPTASCASGCSSVSYVQGSCIPQTTGTAMGICNGSVLTLYFFASSEDCSGSYTVATEPVGQCGEMSTGTYLFDACSSSGGAASATEQDAVADSGRLTKPRELGVFKTKM